MRHNPVARSSPARYFLSSDKAVDRHRFRPGAAKGDKPMTDNKPTRKEEAKADADMRADLIAEATQEIESLRQQLQDMENLYQTTTEHAEVIENQLSDNAEMLERLSRKLSKYLSPQVYQSIFKGETEARISAKRKKLTVFFSDIVGFTATTDHMESEEMTALLNHYLTDMSAIATAYGATVDKYIGDAILAFFGDPETRGEKDDALACVEMAMAMQRRMRELKGEWLARGLSRPFELRMGINTGYCTVGNFGSEDRMDYTIIGGEVNRAARIQSHAKTGGILMSYETYALVQDKLTAIEIDTVMMKGLSEPVRVYEVIDQAHKESPHLIVSRGTGFRIEVDTRRLDGDAVVALRNSARGLLEQLDSADD